MNKILKITLFMYLTFRLDGHTFLQQATSYGSAPFWGQTHWPQSRTHAIGRRQNATPAVLARNEDGT